MGFVEVKIVCVCGAVGSSSFTHSVAIFLKVRQRTLDTNLYYYHDVF